MPANKKVSNNTDSAATSHKSQSGIRFYQLFLPHILRTEASSTNCFYLSLSETTKKKNEMFQEFQ